jgi:hypothetical protein
LFDYGEIAWASNAVEPHRGSASESYSPYHPIFLRSECIGEGECACIDRWVTIAANLRATGAKTLLDLGFAEGYFVQQAAKCG